MRISDWSSDVCSSDLFPDRSHPPAAPGRCSAHQWGSANHGTAGNKAGRRSRYSLQSFILHPVPEFACFRSEEHTSELQSLMRISYAVFCLKKKIKQTSSRTKYTHKTQKYNK